MAGPLDSEISDEVGADWNKLPRVGLTHDHLVPCPLLPNMQPEETTLTMIERITTAMADLDTI
jgi:hypothetical protein